MAVNDVLEGLGPKLDLKWWACIQTEGLRPSWFSVHCTSLTRGPGVWESRGRTEGMMLDSYWDQIVKKLRNQAETLGAFQAGLSRGESTKARVRMALMSLSALPSPGWVIPSPSLSGTQEWVRWPSLAPIFLMWEAIRRYRGLLKVPHGNLWQCEGWIKNQLATAKAHECLTKAWLKYAAEGMKSEA